MNRDLLKQLGDAKSPVFYLTYLPTPNSNPWRDLIGSAVRQWRGREFTISKPDDLVSAWSKIMGQLGSGSWRAGERSDAVALLDGRKVVSELGYYAPAG